MSSKKKRVDEVMEVVDANSDEDVDDDGDEEDEDNMTGQVNEVNMLFDSYRYAQSRKIADKLSIMVTPLLLG